MAMLLRRRLPLLRLLRQLHTESAASASSSSAPPPKPHAAASPSVAPGSRGLGFLSATRLRVASASSSAAAYLAVGAAAALASLPVAYADGNEQGPAPVGPAVSTDPTDGADLARNERKRIMELAQSRGMQRGSYPKFDVAVKGQKVVLSPNFSSRVVSG